MSVQPTLTTVVLAAAVALSACRSPLIGRSAADTGSQAPYPRSRMITGVSWDFSAGTKSRAALGSDLWPCTWARDDNQYCAWGDGGGFDGNDDHIGRVSLGFARLTGIPRRPGDLRVLREECVGCPSLCGELRDFRRKGRQLGFDRRRLVRDWRLLDRAEHAGSCATERGADPFHTIAWSADLGKNWQTALWATPSMLGTFLNFGRDNAGAIDSYVYVYYLRSGDTQHLFLKRVAKDQLLADPSAPGIYQYLSAVTGHGRAARWSASESDAHAIFRDPNNVDTPDVVYDGKLHRYLMTVGHYRSGVLRRFFARTIRHLRRPPPLGTLVDHRLLRGLGPLRTSRRRRFPGDAHAEQVGRARRQDPLVRVLRPE